MNDKPQIKLSETVVLIDAAFLNFVITDMKRYFEETLQRSLQEIDLSMLTTYLTLDAGIAEGKNEVQFLFVYDKESGNLAHCQPSDLKKELSYVYHFYSLIFTLRSIGRWIHLGSMGIKKCTWKSLYRCVGFGAYHTFPAVYRIWSFYFCIGHGSGVIRNRFWYV